MEKIASFTVNHLNLEPGIYESRVDWVYDIPIKTYDLRFTRPNREPVMNTADIHTIEHLVATYLRNCKDVRDDIIYFGPMGCRTGFYLIIKGNYDHEAIFELVRDSFLFVVSYEGEIPGATARDCGNYLDQNLPMAKYVSQRYIHDLASLKTHDLRYHNVD